MLIEDRHGLAMDGCLTPATATANGRPLEMAGGGDQRRSASGPTRAMTSGTREAVRLLAGTPTSRRTPRGGRGDRRPDDAASRVRREPEEAKRIEESRLARDDRAEVAERHRGEARVGSMFVFGLAVYNLVRIRNLVEQAA